MNMNNIITIISLCMIVSSSIGIGYILSYAYPMFIFSGNYNEITQYMSIEISDGAREKLYNLWDEHPEKEYSACIRGHTRIEGDELNESYDKIVLRIIDVYNWKTGTSNYAPIVLCAGELGVIHNHPNIGCRDKLWTGDVQAAKASFRIGNELFLIQCERDKIEVYTRENLYEGRVISIAE